MIAVVMIISFDLFYNKGVLDWRLEMIKWGNATHVVQFDCGKKWQCTIRDIFGYWELGGNLLNATDAS